MQPCGADCLHGMNADSGCDPLPPVTGGVMSDWIPTLSDGSKPRYIAIAEAIQGDLAEGRLLPAQRLPAQRQLARLLGLDFTTVARGYGEAQRRGLIESRVGEGTFVLGVAAHRQAPATRVESEDFSMNMPPEPADAALWTKLGSALESIGRDLASALRYQRFGGTESNKQAAVEWLSRSRCRNHPRQGVCRSRRTCGIAGCDDGVVEPKSRGGAG